MPDYSKGKIYSIRSHLTTDVYIGSTIDTLPKRLFNHKRFYKKWVNKKTNYTTSFKIIEKDDECYIELVELYPCNSKIELHRREGEIIRATTTCVNKCIPGRTIQQITEYQKEYNVKNKEQKKGYNKNYGIINKEIITEQKKIYRENNKQKISERKKQKYTCECGSTLRKDDKVSHEKTTKHQNFITSS